MKVHGFSAVGVLLLMVLVPVTGCSRGEESGTSTVSVRDSAGVRIVESSAPRWADGQGWALSQRPIQQIGSRTGDRQYVFEGISGVVRLPAGELIVANSGSQTVRYYSASGEFLRWSGGPAEGPAQILELTGIERRDAEIYAKQMAGPTRVFGLNSTYLHSLEPPTMPDHEPGLVHGVFADGSALVEYRPTWKPGDPAGDIQLADMFRVPAEGGSPQRLASVPLWRLVQIGSTPLPMEYTPLRQIRVAGERLYVNFSDDYDIEVYDATGRLAQRVRRAWEPVRVTDEDKQRFRQATLNPPSGVNVTTAMRAELEALADGMQFPENHPVHGRILVDATEHLWVERVVPERASDGARFTPVYETPTDWDVFDPEGAWLGTVELPPRFYVFEIGARYAAGVWKNEAGVEFVRVYRLDKPE